MMRTQASERPAASRWRLRFGVFVQPTLGAVDTAIAAENAGLDLVGVADHPYRPDLLDAFTVIGHLLSRTSRIGVFSDVANLPLRPPAMLAKTAASLAILSGGRFDLGLGAGALPDAAAAMVAPARTPGESVHALEEAISLIRAAWSGGSVGFNGRYYHLRGPSPAPVATRPIEIWVGAYKPRMLELTGRLADGWVPSLRYLSPRDAARAGARVAAAASSAGRDPSEIRRIYNVDGVIGAARPGGLGGSPAQWAEMLSEFAVEFGFDTFVLAPAEPVREQIERYAHEVAPAVRAAVARAVPEAVA